MAVVAEVTGSGGVEVGGSADVAFVHGSGAALSDIVLEWDLDNDGDFDQPQESVAGLVEAEALIGRDFPSQLTGRAGVGQLKARLRNDDGRFGFFNEDSPLNTPPFSLKSGRRLRIRTSDAAEPDPTLLARDRFNRPDGPLGQAETGQIWFDVGDADLVVADQQASAPANDLFHNAILDVGTDTYYIQVELTQVGARTEEIDGNLLEVVARFEDFSNFAALVLDVDDGQLQLGNWISAAFTADDAIDVEIYDGMTIGLLIATTGASGGDTMLGFLEGVHVLSGSTTFEGDFVGLEALRSDGQPAPRFDRFHVWDRLPAETEGILWTGSGDNVLPDSPVNRDRTATLTGVGPLIRATDTEIQPPVSVSGRPTGFLVGQALAAGGLLLPPAGVDQLDEGTVTTGAVVRDPDQRRSVLDVARSAEEAELGFLHETQEGHIAFDAFGARHPLDVQAVFSDQPGSQFSYRTLRLKSWRREIFNQVTAGVSPAAPDLDEIEVVLDTRNTAFGVANDVAVEMPATIEDGDLVIVIIASTVSASGQAWNTPFFWVEGRTLGGDEADAIRMRIYWRHARAADTAGETFTFYTDTAGLGGAWIAHIYRIPANQWYGSHNGGGPDLGEFIATHDPREILPSWGTDPSLFIAAAAGLTSTNGGSLAGETYPLGYAVGRSDFLNGDNNGFDAGLQSAMKADVRVREDPGSFDGLSGTTINESVAVAVRGFNGDPIPESGRTEVTVDNVASQDDHRAVRSHRNPSQIFADTTDAEAYAEKVLARWSDDRPLLELKFDAHKNQAYRRQAIRRRVGHAIRVQSDHFGVDRVFFIEHIRHRFAGAGTRWEVTWQLSPA